MLTEEKCKSITRAVDLRRLHESKSPVTEEIVRVVIEEYFNQRYTFDPDGPSISEERRKNFSIGGPSRRKENE